MRGSVVLPLTIHFLFGLRSEGTIQRKLLGAGTGAGDLEAAYLWGRRDVVRVADARGGLHRVIEAVVAHHVVSTSEVGGAHRVGGVGVPHRVLEQDARGAAAEEVGGPPVVGVANHAASGGVPDVRVEAEAPIGYVRKPRSEEHTS